ncbi:GDP-L-fucose synthase [Polynucleobacter duraquae]|uniref:GDP-L-fucose synthase family protein n=1 Tax=Polynucleobacter duraquae TaxID=1835254 RepID=UPI002FF900A3
MAGHTGMVGSSIVRELSKSGHIVLTRTRRELDLLDKAAVMQFLSEEKPDQIYMAAARVGGIYANSTFPASFIYENLAIQTNLIDSAYRTGVKKLLFLGSSCIYPRMAPQPMSENQLLTGPLELTNEAYAIAKIAGIKMCQAYNTQYKNEAIDYRSVMPTNLFGPGDHYDLDNSHVIPGLMRKIYEAKNRGDSEVTVWGTGKPFREFMYVDDLARACIFVMNTNVDRLKKFSDLHRVNIGSGFEISISDLATLISDVVGYKGSIRFDPKKPDGTPRKLLDSSLLHNLGWRPTVDLKEGLKLTYENFLASMTN